MFISVFVLQLLQTGIVTTEPKHTNQGQAEVLWRTSTLVSCVEVGSALPPLGPSVLHLHCTHPSDQWTLNKAAQWREKLQRPDTESESVPLVCYTTSTSILAGD